MGMTNRSKLKSSCAVPDFLEVAGIYFGVRIPPAVRYNSEKQKIADRISGGPHMSGEDLDTLSRKGDKAMENLKRLIENDGPR